MTLNDGGINPDDVQKTAQGNANDIKNNQDPSGQNGGGNADIAKRLDDMQALIESLKKESSGKDKKIAQMLSEKELQELNSKTKEEQLEIYKSKTAMYERKEAYRQSLKEVGLNVDEFMAVADEKDPALQAAKFADIIKKATEKAANDALEKFKTEELKKIGQPPKPTGNAPTNTANFDKNNFLKGIAD
ncbi:MAG: hypothetical protein II306_06570 [Clostridia bacterium]|nr:hypothetical protein [Clostridia bacterium]